MKGLRGCNYLLRAECKRGPMEINPYIHQRFCSSLKNHKDNHHVEIRCEGVHRALGEGFEVKDEQATDTTNRKEKQRR